MRIQSSDIAFTSAHQREDRLTQHVTMRIERAAAAPRPDTVSISERAIQAGVPDAASAPESSAAGAKDDGLPPGLALVKMLLEYLLGKSIDVFQAGKLHDPSDATAAATPPPEAPPAPVT